MTTPLNAFYEELETNYSLGGPRGYLRQLLDRDLVRRFEAEGIFVYKGISEWYTCPHPGGSNCPRRVVDMEDGTYEAVCGNNPRECLDETLTLDDVERLAFDPERFLELIARAVQIRPNYEKLAGLIHTYRVGTFIREEVVRQPVYFIIRTSAHNYSQALGALCLREESRHFAVLFLTDRFINDEVERQMTARGISILPIYDVINLGDKGFVSRVDPIRFFSGIGSSGRERVPPPPVVVARALICDGRNKHAWYDLDERGYDELVAAADDYLVFADELRKWVIKGPKGNTTEKKNVQISYFRMIQALVSKPYGYFDPSTEAPSEDVSSGRQILQRARNVFDIKKDDNSWMLFKSDKIDNRSVYRLSPDEGVSFALIFIPPTEEEKRLLATR